MAGTQNHFARQQIDTGHLVGFFATLISTLCERSSSQVSAAVEGFASATTPEINHGENATAIDYSLRCIVDEP